jgi:hypothetical protein
MSSFDILIANLAKLLVPYQQHVVTSATYLGLFQIIAPALVLNRMRKSKIKSEIPIIPFLFVAVL